MICAWSRETRGSAITRSLSTLRPTVNGVRFRTMFFCSLPWTKTRAGKTPEPELWWLWLIVLRFMGKRAKRVLGASFAGTRSSPTQSTDYSDVALCRKPRGSATDSLIRACGGQDFSRYEHQ